MKSGLAKKEDAVSNDDQGSVCGILDQSNSFKENILILRIGSQSLKLHVE